MRKPVPHAIAASLLLAFAGAAEAQGTTAAPAGRPVVPGAMTSGATANSSNSTAAARASLYPTTSVPSTGTTGTGTNTTGTGTNGTGTNGTGTDTTGTTTGTTASTTASGTDTTGSATTSGTATAPGNTGSTVGTTSGTSSGSTSGLGATGTTSSTSTTGANATGGTTAGTATNGVNGFGNTGFAGGVILPGVATAVPFADPNASVDAGAGVNANGERTATIGGFGTTAVQRAPAATPLLDATTKAATAREINRRNRGQEGRVYGIAPRTNNDRTDQMPDDPIIRY